MRNACQPGGLPMTLCLKFTASSLPVGTMLCQCPRNVAMESVLLAAPYSPILDAFSMQRSFSSPEHGL